MGKWNVCSEQGHVCRVCAHLCAGFERVKSEQTCGFQRCVLCVQGKFKLKFNL